MNRSRYLIFAALVCAFLAAAGCTTGTGPSVPATPAAASPSLALASLALVPAEVPAGYILTERREKDAANMSSLALQLGWQAGYAITYTNTSSGDNQTTIVQTITVYPEKNIPGVISVIGKQERSDSNMSYSDITSLAVGTTSGGYTAKARAPMVLTTDNSNILTPKASITEPLPDIAEVWFSKGTIFEVIRMTGPGADAATVTDLARTAYAKLP
jgi:hypothetical protein